MTDDMLHVMEWHNGEKVPAPFPEAEMSRRLTALRQWMADEDVDAALLTSHHGIAWFSGWPHPATGRRYGMVVTQDHATVISPAIDGGLAWRRGFGGNVTYTDWRRDNFYRAVRQLTPGVGRLAIEGDQTTLDFRARIECALPGVEIADAGPATARMRRVKSAAELALLRSAAGIAAAGLAAVSGAVAEGIPGHELAALGTAAMARRIAAEFPAAGLAETATIVLSGPDTDGARNPVTPRTLRRGDILSVTCAPVLFGYHAALGRTAFLGQPDAASCAVWERTTALHRHALEIIRPGAACSAVAAELNDLCRQWGLLHRRSAGYGQSAGLVSAQSGRDPALDLREDVPTVLQAGMVLSLEPMLMIPEGTPGAGGYRVQDIVVVTPAGAEPLAPFPPGPEGLVLG